MQHTLYIANKNHILVTICGQVKDHLKIPCRFHIGNSVTHQAIWSFFTLPCAIKPQQEALTN